MSEAAPPETAEAKKPDVEKPSALKKNDVEKKMSGQKVNLVDKMGSSLQLEKKSEMQTTEPGTLDPVIEVNEALASEIFDRPTEIGEFEENPPKLYSIHDVLEPLTIESLNNAIYELGVINLCWPDIQEPVFETRTCFPESYYTNSQKERLLLAYAESFRRQYFFHFHKNTCYRKPLLLQAPNECGLQKMVCTTIRVTKLCYTGTNTWQGLASLVSDYFVYEPLTKPMLHLENQTQILVNCRKKLKAARETQRRLKIKVAELSNVLADLRCKKYINSEEAEVLNSIEVENKDFLKRFLISGNSKGRQFSSALRKFSLCLHFISPKAYRYVRTKFNNCLPHPKTLYNWCKVVDCEPGFSKEAFDAIKTLAMKSPKKIICALSFDEMAIRQHLQWDGQKTVGYVDVGDGMDSDSSLVAREALVFLVTGINGSWKLPVGYFLVNGTNAEKKSTLVKTCINLLAECGITVASLTFDGCASNITMAKLLGASLADINKIDPVIKIANQDIVIFPDPCHMIKLVRNALGDKKYLTNGNKKIVSWEYITALHNLQESEGLHMANKLRKSHIQFKKQIMKVRLATQTFSTSVADALILCEELGIEKFCGVESTAEFIRYFNDVFDILNSRKIFSFGYKKPISRKNIAQIKEKLDDFIEYVKGLKLNDVPVLKSERKTGFIGLVCCASAINILYEKFINAPDAPMKYLCTYKMSQDHLELFFGSIRSKGGFNNNPTVIQFKSAYKRLLIHGELKNLNCSGNCMTFEDISILNLNKKEYVHKINVTSTLNNGKDVEDVDILPMDEPEIHDYLDNNCLSEFSQEVTSYIAGFIVKKMKKQLKCDECVIALQSTDQFSRLISWKDIGGLNYPSKDTIDICLYAEKLVRKTLSCEGPNYFTNKKNMPKLIFNVFKYFSRKNIFPQLKLHIFDQEPFDNHLSLLIKSIALRYLEIRIHHVLKTASKSGPSVRNQFTKLILFKGQ